VAKTSINQKIKRIFKISKKRFVKVMIVVLILLFFLIFFTYFVNPVVMDTVEIKSRALATRAINSSISDVVTDGVVYDDLINIVSDEFGNISMMQANSLQINALTRELAKNCEKKIEDIGRVGVTIPVGTFTGIPLLVGRGPRLSIKMIPIGSVICKFVSNFESAGINQTRHRIYLDVQASAHAYMGLCHLNETVDETIVLVETIIVGQVPQSYYIRS
jgi:sporulation protein YunB